MILWGDLTIVHLLDVIILGYRGLMRSTAYKRNHSRTTKKISRPKYGGSLKDFLLASEKQFDIKPDAKPKAPKNHDSDVLVFKGPFEVEHADLLVFLLEACPGEMMRKLEERVKILTKEQVDFVIQALRSCPKEVVGKLAEQFALITSEELDRLTNIFSKRPLDILGEMDLKGSGVPPLMKSRKMKAKIQKVKLPIIPKEMEPKATQNDNRENGGTILIEKDHQEHDLLKERELTDLKENQSLVKIKIEKDDHFKMEPKVIENGNEGDQPENVKEVNKPKDPEAWPGPVEMETKKGKNQKKMELESSDYERVNFSHKFPSINPRCLIYCEIYT